MISTKELNEERRFLNEEALPAIMQFIRIPSKSRFCDPDWERNGQLVRALREGAQWGEKLFPEGVFEILTLPGKTPALFFDIPAENHDGRPAFFYGHFDKQPEAEGWSEGLAPFTPVVRDGKLYGRGGADDGYSFYTSRPSESFSTARADPRASPASSRRTKKAARGICQTTFRPWLLASALRPYSPSSTWAFAPGIASGPRAVCAASRRSR